MTTPWREPAPGDSGDGSTPIDTVQSSQSSDDPKDLLRSRPWRWWQLTTFFGQLNGSMSMLALTLAGLYATGSEAMGVQMAGIVSLSAGLVGPFEGRRLDRMDVRAGLQRALAAAGAVLVVLCIAVGLHASWVVLYLLAALEGLCIARVMGGQRALLAACVGRHQLRRAHFIASLVTEVGFVVGPPLVTLLAVIGGALAALVGMAVTLFVAAIGPFGYPIWPLGRLKSPSRRHNYGA